MSHAQDQMGAVQIEQRPRRKTRACVPCHERKVRCNAFEAGLPCTRCVNSRRAEACILIPVQEKTGGWVLNSIPRNGFRATDTAANAWS